jgi:hypothetical protein
VTAALDSMAELIWRRAMPDRATIDWLEAPARERKRFTEIAAEVAKLAQPVERERLEADTQLIARLETNNRLLAIANHELKAELLDETKPAERLLSKRASELFRLAQDETLSPRTRRGLRQRADEVGTLIGKLREVAR